MRIELVSWGKRVDIAVLVPTQKAVSEPMLKDKRRPGSFDLVVDTNTADRQHVRHHAPNAHRVDRREDSHRRHRVTAKVGCFAYLPEGWLAGIDASFAGRDAPDLPIGVGTIGLRLRRSAAALTAQSLRVDAVTFGHGGEVRHDQQRERPGER